MDNNTTPTFRVESCGPLRGCHNIFYVVMQRLGDVLVQMCTRLASSAVAVRRSRQCSASRGGGPATISSGAKTSRFNKRRFGV